MSGSRTVNYIQDGQGVLLQKLSCQCKQAKSDLA